MVLGRLGDKFRADEATFIGIDVGCLLTNAPIGSIVSAEKGVNVLVPAAGDLVGLDVVVVTFNGLNVCLTKLGYAMGAEVLISSEYLLLD